MLKGGALLYAITISLIIALICLSLILLSSFIQLQTTQYRELDRLRLNSTSGINLLLSQYEIPKNKRVQIDLFGNNTDSVELYKNHWGVFDLISSRAFWRGNNFVQAAIEGYELEESERFALYLADNDKSLSVCGKTVISGKSYLPKAGVKRAYIEGQYFAGDKLINGEILESKKAVPPLDKELIQRLSADYRNYSPLEEPKKAAELYAVDSVSNSFSKETLVFYATGNIELDNQFISGNIIIISDEAIEVGSGTKLYDVILTAPKIIFNETFHGSCQAIASEEIEIKNNCIFDYPSTVAICYEGTTGTLPLINIGEGSKINGVVVSTYASVPITSSSRSKIIVEKNAQIHGQVYSSSSVDLKGSIYGSLICGNIVLTTPSSVYENHLLNATVDISKLSRYYTGINTADIYSSKRIIKWLY